MSPETPAERLERVLARHVSGGEVQDQVPLTMQGVDSLSIFSLIADLEKAFDVRIEASEIEDGALLTPASLLSFVTSAPPTGRSDE